MKKEDLKSPRYWGFQHQLTLSFTAAVMCFALIGAVWISWMEGKRDLQNILEQGVQITSSFARQSVLALLYGLGENALSQAEITLRFPSVKHVGIYTKDGQALLQRGSGSDWEPELAEPGPGFVALLAHETPQTWHFIAPVYSQAKEEEPLSPFELNRPDPEYLGFVQVVVSKAGLHSIKKKKFLDILVSTFIFALVTLALLLWLTSRLTKPLNNLAQLMKRAENGEPAVRADPYGPREVINMSRAFNKMMSVLEERAKRLDGQNNILLQEIKERRQAEEEREQLQKQLLQARKMEAIGQLTGGIAHDFNNILASILGFTELALHRFANPNEGKLFDYLTEVHRAGERARDLVAQMMAFSRGNSGSPQLLDTKPLVKEVVKMLSSILPTSIQVATKFDKSMPAIKIDPVQLQQVVLNLCINARDAMHGKGQLTIQGQRTTVLKRVCASCHEKVTGEFLELIVEDSGTGIEEGLLNSIFDPFFTTKDVGSGTGMGLSVVHGIVHKHGGHIDVETKIGQGAKFRLLFPVKDCAKKTGPSDETELEIPRQFGRGHILVVDDEPAITVFLEELLNGHGYHVSAFTDAQAALAYFESEPDAVDLVITDQTMPNLTGSELATNILSIRADMPIILCTGYSEQIDAARTKELNIRSFFTKPINTGELLAVVKQNIKESTNELKYETALSQTCG
jgi:signal transduction histidine kinase/ActR/RegA family two-component response regulator